MFRVGTRGGMSVECVRKRPVFACLTARQMARKKPPLRAHGACLWRTSSVVPPPPPAPAPTPRPHARRDISVPDDFLFNSYLKHQLSLLNEKLVRIEKTAWFLAGLVVLAAWGVSYLGLEAQAILCVCFQALMWLCSVAVMIVLGASVPRTALCQSSALCQGVGPRMAIAREAGFVYKE